MLASPNRVQAEIDLVQNLMLRVNARKKMPMILTSAEPVDDFTGSDGTIAVERLDKTAEGSFASPA